MQGFSTSVAETNRQLSAKERVSFKDTSNAVKLDEATKESSLHIRPMIWGILNIHNEKSDDKDYQNYVVIADDGTKYVTGSQSFWSSFKEIADEMENESEEWGVVVYRQPSKNYVGRDFITCSIE